MMKKIRHKFLIFLTSTNIILSVSILVFGFYLWTATLTLPTTHYKNFVISSSPRKQQKRSNVITKTAIMKHDFDDKFYIKSAYRVSDTTIRIAMVKSVKNNQSLFYEFGDIRGEVQITCHQPHCPDDFSPPCSIHGYIGLIENLDKSLNASELKLVIDNEKSAIVYVTDVYLPVKPSYKHKLGVCLQPIYLHTDFTIFIQFFEYWLAEGATKFYIYRESYTKKVEEILKFYQATSNVDIEIIDWSRLPFDDTSRKENNPNRYWFRLEAFLAIFDCVHRAKGKVKYLAQTDLDELFWVKNDLTLIDFMDFMNENMDDKMAYATFRSQRAKISDSWNSISYPSEFKFDDFKTIKLENTIFERYLYTKMIYRPDRTFRTHIHRPRGAELMPNSTLTYKHAMVDPQDAVILHIRRLTDMYAWKNSQTSKILDSKSRIWQENFRKRLEEYDFENATFTNYGSSINEEIENCRQKMNKNRRKTCHNIWDCEKLLNNIDQEKFIRANYSWIII